MNNMMKWLMIGVMGALVGGCTLPQMGTMPILANARDACLELATAVETRVKECSPTPEYAEKWLAINPLNADNCEHLSPTSSKRDILEECIPDVSDMSCEQLKKGYKCDGLDTY